MGPASAYPIPIPTDIKHIGKFINPPPHFACSIDLKAKKGAIAYTNTLFPSKANPAAISSMACSEIPQWIKFSGNFSLKISNAGAPKSDI